MQYSVHAMIWCSSYVAESAIPAETANCMQIGVMHTNYKELGRRIAGPLVVPFLHAMVATLCAIHCHKVTSHCRPPPSQLTTPLLLVGHAHNNNNLLL